MAWNQPYFWPGYETSYRPQMHNRMPRHRGTAPNPYGGPTAYYQSLNPLAAVEQQLPIRRSLLATPYPTVSGQRLYMDFAGPVKLELQYKVNSISAEVFWSPPGLSQASKFQYQVRIVGCSCCTLEVPNWRRNVRIQVVSGQWYDVSVKAVTSGKMTLAEGRVKFKAILSQAEIYSLSLKAQGYVGGGMHRFEFFYRNKPKRYWDEIRYRDGIMRPYLKDNNGNPGNPINGEINGLFFSSNLANGEFPKCSPFGDVRLYVPAPYLLNPDCHMYFSDFYCIYAIHYVTVVVTRPGSLADQFCAKQLVRLSPQDNVFICVRPSVFNGRLEYWVNGNVWVELYVTEDVDIRVGRFSLVRSTGQSTPGGLKNNQFCQVCNLYPKEPETVDEIAIAQGQKALADVSRPNKRPFDPSETSEKRRKTAADNAYTTTTHTLIANLLTESEKRKQSNKTTATVIDLVDSSNEDVTVTDLLEVMGEFHSQSESVDTAKDAALLLCSLIDQVVDDCIRDEDVGELLDDLVSQACQDHLKPKVAAVAKRKRKCSNGEEFDYSDSECASTCNVTSGSTKQLESFFSDEAQSGEIPDYEAKFQEWIESSPLSKTLTAEMNSFASSTPVKEDKLEETLKMSPIKKPLENAYPWTNGLYKPVEVGQQPPVISTTKAVTKGFLSPPTRLSSVDVIVMNKTFEQSDSNIDVNMNRSGGGTDAKQSQLITTQPVERSPPQQIASVNCSRSRYAQMPNRPNLILLTAQEDAVKAIKQKSQKDSKMTPHK